jgi:nitrite reductase (NADH) small subunit/3-phenylpropionate/trans-cinnamate dioxygenase ferredoxin subunit
LTVARWVNVAAAGEIPVGSGKTLRVAGRELAVFNDAGTYFAMDDACPHQGASLGEGTLHKGRVICPWHSWLFDVRSGECPQVEGIRVETYRVRSSDGVVEVEIPD